MRRGYPWWSRGLAGPVVGLALLWAVGVPPARAQETKDDQPDRLPTGEKILDKTIKARGGREAFEALTSRVSKGTIEIAAGGQNIKGKLETYAAPPNKFYHLRDLGAAGKIELGCDAEVYWAIERGKARLRQGDELRAATEQADFLALLNWRDYYDNPECLGKETIDGRSCYKVAVTNKDGETEHRFYDRKTGLLCKMESTTKGQQGDVKNETRYDDYRDVGGVKFPFKVVQAGTAGAQKQVTTITWTSIEVNVDLPEDRFALPESVAKLVRKPAPPRPGGAEKKP